MPVPVSISSLVSALDDDIVAAQPLAQASFDTLNALAYSAGLLAQSADDAIGGAAGQLDIFSAPLMPQDIIAGVLALSDAATTQTALIDLQTFVSRIEISLENRF